MLCRLSKGENAVGRLVKLGIKGHLSNNFILYLFTILFLIMGIIFGAIGVKALTPQQLSSLNQYIDTGLETAGKQIDYQSTAKHAIWRNSKTIMKVWFLGLTVIGLPLILVIIFTRGFVLGFTVGFLLENKAWQGLGIILLTIFPQNLLHLPSLILAGTSAIGFSLYLINGKKYESRPISHYFLKYSFIMLILTLVMVLAGLIEGYVTPLATKVFSLW